MTGRSQGVFPGPEVQVPEVQVKICGLTRREDARLAVGEGADYLGVVLVPGGPRALSPEVARGVVEGVASTVAQVVAVMADLGVQEAARAGETVGAAVLQLHGEEAPGVVAELRELGPWKVWKALTIRGVEDLQEGVARFGEVADGLLLDGWHPNRRGGTGTPFSWEALEEVRDTLPPGLRLIAAGGLTPMNVAEAVRRLRPGVVDVSSGVESSPGVKDPSRVRAFLAAARGPGGRG